MNEATEPPNSSISLIPEIQVMLEYYLFSQGFMKYQKKKVLEFFHCFIPPYKDQGKADQNDIAW